MGLSSADIARIHVELNAERVKQIQKWDTVAPPLNVLDSASRYDWVQERERFYNNAGPIPTSQSDRDSLALIKNKFKGERIFVIGNGPSLNCTALNLLEDEFTFGVNRIYMMFERISWRPTFYTTLDWRFVPDSVSEINELADIQCFFPERFQGLLRDGDNVLWYANDGARHGHEKGFATDASLGIRGAGSVTGAAIQLAYHLGFDPIYTIGCDASYSVSETVTQEGPDKFGNGVGLYLTSNVDDDANHFDKRYFGTGKRWHDPNVSRMIEGFQQCQDGAQRHGRTVLNATVGGELEVFDRVDFRSLFEHHQQHAPPPSLASFLVACLGDSESRQFLDIGAGTGSHTSVFAALGWSVRCVEPDPQMRSLLQKSMPYHWDIIIDPRGVDSVSGLRMTYRDASASGLTLAPMSDASVSEGQVLAATPEIIIEPMKSPGPDVVAIDANGWEMETLRSWPFSTASPKWFIVGFDDRIAPRFGFSRKSLAKLLSSQGYEVLVVENSEIFPPCAPWLDSTEGCETVLIAGPSSKIPTADRLLALKVAHDVLVEFVMKQSITLTRANAGTPILVDETAAALQNELIELRSSASWNIGHLVVRSIKRFARPILAIKRVVRSIRKRAIR